VIGLGQLDLRRAALRVVADVEENTLAESARRNRQRAGLYELMDWLKKQAAKHGSQVLTAERPVTTTCHATGQRIAPPKDAINYACPACGSHHDRDENAARVALADAAGAPRAVPDATKPPRRSRFKRIDSAGETGGAGAAAGS
jgi:putative transposase